MASIASTSLPIIPLPKDLVLLPGVILKVPVLDRQDIPALLTQVYRASSTTRAPQTTLLGVLPQASSLLSKDGKRLSETEDPANLPQENAVSTADVPTKENLYNYGTVAKLNGVEGRALGKWTLIIEGISRFRVEEYSQTSPFLQANITHQEEDANTSVEIAHLFLELKRVSLELLLAMRLSALLSTTGSSPILPTLGARLGRHVERYRVANAGSLADFMANLVNSSFEEKLEILAMWDVKARLEKAIELVTRQLGSAQGDFKLISITSTSIPPEESDPARDNPLLEFLRGRRPSTGQRPPNFKIPFGIGPPGRGTPEEEPANELDEVQQRLDAAQLSEEARKVSTREMKRLRKMNPAQAEYQVCRNYLENIIEVPWITVTEDHLDRETLARARKQLDDDHYGLEKVKKRLLEYLAILRLKQSANSILDKQVEELTAQAAGQDTEDPDRSDTKDNVSYVSNAEAQLRLLKGKRRVDKSPILLLVGPPGTGKTSLAKSVATALGRKFHRISLGGIRDEADIRGHRRTYVAAMPGLVITGLKKVGTANPVILLDEIDKVGMSNFQGDPQAALLEVLDPEQNWAFSDHYMGVPIDLSKVLFIATANSLDTIAAPLLDRMETISLSGYTTVEKRHIAIQHLIPKQITTNALQPENISMQTNVIDQIINSYTREAGVRNLERELGSICRAKAIEFAEAQDSSSIDQYSALVTVDDLEDILGAEKFEEEIAGKTSRPGVVTGLVAYSSGGSGSILFIEVAEMPGKGTVQLTGKLGDVLKESVEVALSWVKGHAMELGLTRDPSEDIMAGRSLHVHCPAGAIPKDGPSAGLAHTIAMISLFSGKAVPPTLAMTGEISLRGRVTAVGGIKEKLIGAHRAGVKTILLPSRNRKDIKELPQEVRDGLDIIPVSHIWEAMKHVWPETHWPGEEDLAGIESRL